MARHYEVNESTIQCIQVRKDKSRKAYASPEILKSKQHLKPAMYQEMQEALKIWLEDMQRWKLPLSGPMIQTQTVKIQGRIDEREGKQEEEVKFTASSRWLHKFMKSVRLCNICLQGGMV